MTPFRSLAPYPTPPLTGIVVYGCVLTLWQYAAFHDYSTNVKIVNAAINWFPSFVDMFQPVLHDWCNKDRGMCNPVCRKE